MKLCSYLGKMGLASAAVGRGWIPQPYLSNAEGGNANGLSAGGRLKIRGLENLAEHWRSSVLFFLGNEEHEPSPQEITRNCLFSLCPLLLCVVFVLEVQRSVGVCVGLVSVFDRGWRLAWMTQRKRNPRCGLLVSDNIWLMFKVSCLTCFASCFSLMIHRLKEIQRVCEWGGRKPRVLYQISWQNDVTEQTRY